MLRVVERRRRARFAQEQPHRGRVVAQVLGQALQRDDAAEPLVARLAARRPCRRGRSRRGSRSATRAARHGGGALVRSGGARGRAAVRLLLARHARAQRIDLVARAGVLEVALADVLPDGERLLVAARPLERSARPSCASSGASSPPRVVDGLPRLLHGEVEGAALGEELGERVAGLGVLGLAQLHLLEAADRAVGVAELERERAGFEEAARLLEQLERLVRGACAAVRVDRVVVVEGGLVGARRLELVAGARVLLGRVVEVARLLEQLRRALGLGRLLRELGGLLRSGRPSRASARPPPLRRAAVQCGADQRRGLGLARALEAAARGGEVALEVGLDGVLAAREHRVVVAIHLHADRLADHLAHFDGALVDAVLDRRSAACACPAGGTRWWLHPSRSAASRARRARPRAPAAAAALSSR